MQNAYLLKNTTKITNLIFYLSTFLIITKKYSNLTNAPELTKILLIANILILTIGLFFHKVNKTEIVLLIISSATYIPTLNPEFAILILYLINSKKIKKSNYVNFFLIVNLLFFITIILLNKLNLIPSQDIHYRLIDDIKTTRDDLGFQNPNSVFLYFTPIILSYIYIRYQKWSFLDTIIYCSVVYFIYSISLSRTGLAVNSITILMIYAAKKIPNTITTLTKYSIILFFTITLIISIFFYDSPILNLILSNRPYIWHEYFINTLSLQSIIGQPLADKSKALPLDNSYVPLVIYQGVSYMLFIFSLYLKGLSSNKLGMEVFIISLYILCYSMFENILFNLEFNITLVLLYLSIRNKNEQ